MSPFAESRPARAPHANVRLTATALAVASLFPLAARAQSVPPPPAAAASAPAAAASAAEAPQTIYVTATRRREPARDGAGAMGGVVKYVTNEPDTSEFSGKVSVGASATKGGGAGNTVSGVVNVPLRQDFAALRVAAFHDHDGGWVDVLEMALGGPAQVELARPRTLGMTLTASF